MRKGSTRRPQADEEPATPVKNYITPSGLQRLKDEHRFLLTKERPAVTEVVAWAASNCDRSENADYQYGKRRLRQIDGRIRFQANRSRGSGGSGNSESGASGDEGILRSDPALCQCRGSIASGEHR
jgi:Transcription elongation factor, N-terminal